MGKGFVYHFLFYAAHFSAAFFLPSQWRGELEGEPPAEPAAEGSPGPRAEQGGRHAAAGLWRLCQRLGEWE
jgi:hypothetical protein